MADSENNLQHSVLLVANTLLFSAFVVFALSTLGLFVELEITVVALISALGLAGSFVVFVLGGQTVRAGMQWILEKRLTTLVLVVGVLFSASLLYTEIRQLPPSALTPTAVVQATSETDTPTDSPTAAVETPEASATATSTEDKTTPPSLVATDAPPAPIQVIPFNQLEVHWNLEFMVLYNASSASIPKDEIMKLRFDALTRSTVTLLGTVWNSQPDSNWSVLRPGRCLLVFNLAQTAEAPSLTDVSIEVPACNTEEEVTVYVGVVAARAAWYPGYDGFTVYYEDVLIGTCTEEPCILPQSSTRE